MRSIRLLLLTIASFSLLQIAQAQRGNPDIQFLDQSISHMVADFMQQHEVPGMAMAIVQAPYITDAASFGLSNTESRTLVSTRTVFNVGQMSEAYIAVAALQLVESDKLKLDDTIGTYLDKVEPLWKEITIRQLLQHQSGLPPEKGAPASKPEFTPGTRFQYSPFDYELLTAAIEKVSGEALQNFIRKGQFERLSLRDTYFSDGLEEITHENIGKGQQHKRFLRESILINPTEFATGYRREAGTMQLVKPGALFAIYSSATDVSIWDIGLAGDILINDPELRKVLYQPAKLADGKVVPSSGPWYFPGHPGLMVVTGSSEGFSSLLSRFTKSDELVCVTLLANKEGLDLTQLARRIAGAYNPKLGPPASTVGQRVQQSPYSVNQTISRLEQILKQRGFTIVARVDHAKAAQGAELKLSPNEELIFGKPKEGTLLMQKQPSISVALPLRAAAWEENGEVWLSAVDPMELVQNYGAGEMEELSRRMRDAIDSALLKAVSSESLGR